MRDPQQMPGTVLGGRYQLDVLRADATASSAGAMQFDATDLSSNEGVSVRIVPLARLVDPLLGSTTPTDALAAFVEQCDIATSLRHPCIETILDHGDITLDGERYAFVVAERLAGGSLREFLDRGRRLTPSQALIVGVDICRALDAAAKQGVVHGDLRPSRLVFGLDRRIRVVGFGAPLRPLDALGLDQALYGAPELADGAGRSSSSDVYSLALILVEALTGEVPFAADTVAAALANRLGKLLPVSAEFGALASVLERAGRPTAEERYSPREFGQALVQCAEKLPRPTPVDVVGTGLFDEEVEATDPSKPTPRPDLSAIAEPVQNVAPQDPIVIRTTPRVGQPDNTAPEGVSILGEMPTVSGQPLVIGSDETGPVSIDADALAALAAEDPTSQAPRPKKRRWGLRIGVALLVVALLGGGGTIAWFTVLNPKNPVPQLAGLTEAAARNQVSRYGWGITVKKERNDTIAAGQIIRTDPVLGSNLAKRDTLTLVVSEGPTLSVLPDITGLTADDAKAKLEAIGLTANAVDTPDETIPAGTIISWSVADQPTLKAGDSVVKDTAVSIAVSSGPALRTIPDLTGKSEADATAALTQLGLVTAKADAVGSPTIPAGAVVTQTPAAAQQVARGTTVTITLSLGQQHTLIPSIYGHDITVVKDRLLKAGMVIGKVTGNTKRGLKTASIDGKVVHNFDRVIVGTTVDLVFP
jgi:serine/threonine-protein kinase